ncbi:MAG: nickel-dependent hydrogenase large subunit [Candidatus Hodarchaeota archaeon]
MSSVRIAVNPFSRSEGGLGVALDWQGAGSNLGETQEAKVAGMVWRGIERIVQDRTPLDAPIIAQRICGACSMEHSIASNLALENALGLTQDDVPRNALLIRNIAIGLSFIMNNLYSLYVKMFPDYSGLLFHLISKGSSLYNLGFGDDSAVYSPWEDEQADGILYGALSDIYGTNHPTGDFLDEVKKISKFDPFAQWSSYMQALTFREKMGEALAIFGGRSPHSHFVVLGGVSFIPSITGISNAKNLVLEVASFVGTDLIYERAVRPGPGINPYSRARELVINTGDKYGLEGVSGTLSSDLKNIDVQTDSNAFDLIGELTQYPPAVGTRYSMYDVGIGVNRYLSFGCLHDPDASEVGDPNKGMIHRGGFSINGSLVDFESSKIVEKIGSSWYDKGEGGPSDIASWEICESQTTPLTLWNNKYSWIKAPRYDGYVVEVGSLARMIINGWYKPYNGSLLKGVYGPSDANLWSSSVMDRIYAKVLETQLFCLLTLWCIDELEKEVKIKGNKVVYNQVKLPEKGEFEGGGLIESPRGSLGQWIKIKDKNVENYQVITPTNWNASPRDENGKGGAMEQALTNQATASNILIELVNTINSLSLPLHGLVHLVELSRIVRSFDPCTLCASQ